jgi:predicted  nucleic acid-binding Zn-ribbon protein
MTNHADTIIKAHNDAMMALAADVHPYTQSAIDAHEQTIRDNLAALVAERDEAVRELDETVEAYHVRLDEEAKRGAHVCETIEGWRPCPSSLCEGEELRNQLLLSRAINTAIVEGSAEWQLEASDLKHRAEAAKARITELEAALGEMHHLIQTRRTSIHMDGTEMFAQPILAQLNSIARAALAKEDA